MSDSSLPTSMRLRPLKLTTPARERVCGDWRQPINFGFEPCFHVTQPVQFGYELGSDIEICIALREGDKLSGGTNYRTPRFKSTASS